MFVVLVVCLVCWPHVALSSYSDGAKSGDFDNWVFALEWQPQWILGPCNSGSDPLLTDPKNFNSTSYAATHLSLHGLWPNYNETLRGSSWPQYCVTPDGTDYRTCEHDGYKDNYCQPTAQSLSQFNVTKRWMTYAPEYSYSDLASHEWSKHGSCTGWDQIKYFTEEENMYNRLRSGNGFSYVTANVGKSVPYQTLYNAFAVDTKGKRLALVCQGCDLSEVWTAWDADPKTHEPTSPIDTSDEDTCERCSLVTILAFAGCDTNPVCLPGQRGPACIYNTTTAGTQNDPCLVFEGCLRCPSSSHSGVHYCTSTP